jgi:hypothetical protein
MKPLPIVLFVSTRLVIWYSLSFEIIPPAALITKGQLEILTLFPCAIGAFFVASSSRYRQREKYLAYATIGAVVAFLFSIWS